MCETENVGRVHARRPEGSEVRSPGPSLFSETRIVPDRYPEGQLPGSPGPLETPRILVPVNTKYGMSGESSTQLIVMLLSEYRHTPHCRGVGRSDHRSSATI